MNIFSILSVQFGKNTAIKTEVFTSQREIIRTLKVTNIDFFTQKRSLPTCPMYFHVCKKILAACEVVANAHFPILHMRCILPS